MATELEKMVEVKDKSQAIGEFLSWLGQQGVYLCEHHEDRHIECQACEGYGLVDGDPCGVCGPLMARQGSRGSGEEFLPAGYYEVRKSIEQVLAWYFGIDLKVAEQERQGLPDELSKAAAA